MVSSRHIGVVFAVVIAGALISAAQTPTPEAVNEDRYTAPVVWTRYKIPNQNLSISMPKLPVVNKLDDPCSQTEGARYLAYAEQAVYEFIWYANSEKPFPKECKTTHRFGMRPFVDRLDTLSRSPGVIESEAKIMASRARMFRMESAQSVKTTWLHWDIDRWFELSVVRRKDAVSNEDKFVGSVSLAATNDVEIGSGSSRMIGDRLAESPKAAPVQAADIIEPIFIITKPRAGYTEIARTKNTQGTVILEVTLFRNGSIGPITVVKGLENGMTELTIAAAERVVFLPQRKNGVPETVVKRLEYSFSIY